MSENDNSKFFPSGDPRCEEARTMLPHTVSELCVTAQGFDPVRGGRFECPCCGSKLGLYFKNGQYNIQDFEGCGHFGYNGKYPNDSVGIYLAAHGFADWNHADLLAAYENTCGGAGLNGESVREYMERQRVRLREASAELTEVTKANLGTIEQKTAWGPSEPLRRLLSMRGIDISALHPSVASQIGVINTKVKRLRDATSVYTWRGMVFALGRKEELESDGRKVLVNPGYQLRCTYDTPNGPMFVTKEMEKDTSKHWQRFYNHGYAQVFNIGALENAGEMPIFVTEGPIDALSVLAMSRRGNHYPVNAVGLQGVKNSMFFIDAVKKHMEGHREFNNVIYLAFDQDKAGRQALVSMTDGLRELGLTAVTMPLPSGIKDMNELLVTDPARGKQLIVTAEYLAVAFKRGLMDVREVRQRLVMFPLDSLAGEMDRARTRILDEIRERANAKAGKNEPARAERTEGR